MAEVISLYAVVDAYRKLCLHSKVKQARHALMHQEQELREKRSLEEKGVCILCGYEKPKPREDEWR